MKFVIAVVMLAVAAVQASVVPLAYSSWGLPAISAPLDGTWTERQFAPRLIAPYAAPLAYAAHAPIAYAAPAPLAYAAAPAVIAAPLEASYVAANRGSVHVAPLPGHTESTSSVNLQPAPGTL